MRAKRHQCVGLSESIAVARCGHNATSRSLDAVELPGHHRRGGPVQGQRGTGGGCDARHGARYSVEFVETICTQSFHEIIHQAHQRSGTSQVTPATVRLGRPPLVRVARTPLLHQQQMQLVAATMKAQGFLVLMVAYTLAFVSRGSVTSAERPDRLSAAPENPTCCHSWWAHARPGSPPPRRRWSD